MKSNYNDYGGDGGGLGYKDAANPPVANNSGVIDRAFNTQSKVFAELSGELFALQDRLSPVLGPSAPSERINVGGGGATGAINPPTLPRVVARVNDLTNGLEHATSVIRDMLTRLEL